MSRIDFNEKQSSSWQIAWQISYSTNKWKEAEQILPAIVYKQI